jgi:hypothetical protein
VFCMANFVETRLLGLFDCNFYVYFTLQLIATICKLLHVSAGIHSALCSWPQLLTLVSFVCAAAVSLSQFNYPH